MGLVDVLQTEPCGTDAFSVRFSPDGGFLAAGGAQGQVSIYNVLTGQEAYRLNISETERNPVKQVCWRPERADAPMRTRGVLVGADTDGRLQQWHVTSCRLLQTWDDTEESGQFLCLDYAPDGRHLAAAGLRGDVFVFDEETRGVSSRLRGGDGLTTPGHSSRVFALRYPQANSDGNLIITGGWDSTVQFWDVRAGHSVRAIFGPRICGDAIDIDASGQTLLTGSYRERDQLELWDIGTGKPLTETLPWRAQPRRRDCMIYCARFSRDSASSMVAAGGAVPVVGTGEAKVIARGGAGKPSRCLGTLPQLQCLSADFSPSDSSLVAFGGHDGRVRLMRLDSSVPNPQDDDLEDDASQVQVLPSARTEPEAMSDGEHDEEYADEGDDFDEEPQTSVSALAGLSGF